MPLQTNALKNDIKTLLDQLSNQTENPDEARELFATSLAQAIETFVKSGDGLYLSGSLQSSGSPVVAVSAVQVKIE